MKIPPRSPWGIIQEDLWPNEFQIIIVCLLLNKTSRKQVEKVLPKLFASWPDAKSMSTADPESLAKVIAPLGLQNRRSKTLINFSKKFFQKDWKHVHELPGVGEYAAAAWEIFCLGKLPQECPKDHALVKYYHWRKSNEVT
jgi:methyl-CpG-binding domain protein 4